MALPTLPVSTGANTVGESGDAPEPAVRKRRSLTGGPWGWLFVAPGLLGLVVFVIAPLLGSLVLALFDYSVLGGGTFNGLENFTTLLSDPLFLNSSVVTTIFVVVYTPLNIALSLAMALWLNTSLAGKTWLRVLFLIPALSPMVANAAVFRLLLQNDGAINGALGIIGIGPVPWLSEGSWALTAIILVSLWQSFGYNMIVLGAGLDSINADVIAASKIDGAGPVRRFFSITLPLLSPALFFTTVLTVIGAWQVFIQAYIITGGGPGQSTTTVMMYLYQAAFTYDQLGYASAVAAVLFMIIALTTLVQVRGQKKWVHYD
jgi:multiple sugar transport system permease protein